MIDWSTDPEAAAGPYGSFFYDDEARNLPQRSYTEIEDESEIMGKFAELYKN